MAKSRPNLPLPTKNPPVPALLTAKSLLRSSMITRVCSEQPPLNIHHDLVRVPLRVHTFNLSSYDLDNEPRRAPHQRVELGSLDRPLAEAENRVSE